MALSSDPTKPGQSSSAQLDVPVGQSHSRESSDAPPVVPSLDGLERDLDEQVRRERLGRDRPQFPPRPTLSETGLTVSHGRGDSDEAGEASGDESASTVTVQAIAHSRPPSFQTGYGDDERGEEGDESNSALELTTVDEAVLSTQETEPDIDAVTMHASRSFVSPPELFTIGEESDEEPASRSRGKKKEESDDSTSSPQRPPFPVPHVEDEEPRTEDLGITVERRAEPTESLRPIEPDVSPVGMQQRNGGGGDGVRLPPVYAATQEQAEAGPAARPAYLIQWLTSTTKINPALISALASSPELQDAAIQAVRAQAEAAAIARLPHYERDLADITASQGQGFRIPGTS